MLINLWYPKKRPPSPPFQRSFIIHIIFNSIKVNGTRCRWAALSFCEHRPPILSAPPSIRSFWSRFAPAAPIVPFNTTFEKINFSESGINHTFSPFFLHRSLNPHPLPLDYGTHFEQKKILLDRRKEFDNYNGNEYGDRRWESGTNTSWGFYGKLIMGTFLDTF